jgi:hypothetical protein
MGFDGAEMMRLMARGPDSLRPSLAWWGVADPLSLAEALARQLERDGWERTGTEEIAEPIMMRHMTLRRGFEERIILASGVAGTSVQLLVPRSGGVT